MSKDATEAAKAMKKGSKDKKDRQAQGFKENLKRLLLPTSAAEIEAYKKAMREKCGGRAPGAVRSPRARYEAQQQQKQAATTAPLAPNKSEEFNSAAAAAPGFDLGASQSAPAPKSLVPTPALAAPTLGGGGLSESTRAFQPAPPTEPRPNRTSKSYTPEQVAEAHEREAAKESGSKDGAKEGKKEKKDAGVPESHSREREAKDKDRDAKESSGGQRRSNRGEEHVEKKERGGGSPGRPEGQGRAAGEGAERQRAA